MKVGIGSYAFRWAIGTQDFAPSSPLTPSGLLDKAAALGAEVVQVCDNLPLDALPNGALADLARRAAELGLTLEVGIQSSQPERLRRNLGVAQRLGARLLRVVLADAGREPPLDEHVTVIKALLPDLHAADVTLAIENHFRLRPVELARLVEAVGDPSVGVCLDPLNSIAKLVGPAETVATLAPFAVSVHVKDALVKRVNTGFCIVGCPLGKGLVDVPGLLAAVRAAGRSPNLLVEGWMDRLQDESATLTQEEAWVRQGIEYLLSLLPTPAPERRPQ
jgi:sugar phosphate isomerase/epimerase